MTFRKLDASPILAKLAKTIDERKVIDMATREPWRIAQHEPTEAERVAAFVNACADNISKNAALIRGAAGIDLALRALHQAADDLKTNRR